MGAEFLQSDTPHVVRTLLGAPLVKELIFPFVACHVDASHLTVLLSNDYFFSVAQIVAAFVLSRPADSLFVAAIIALLPPPIFGRPFAMKKPDLCYHSRVLSLHLP